MAMSYQEARRIKNTGLKDLIAQNIVSGQGVGSAIGSSISQSFRSKMTGIKERFDPLNIAKKLTGNLGAAILGRMTGRSQKDISYFAGGRRGNSSAGITQDTDMENMGRALYTNVSEGQRQRMRKGDSVTNVLAKLYNLMKKGYEAEEKRRERTIKDKINEEDEKILRHKELLEAITGMKYTGKASNPAKKEEGGIFDFLKNMFDDAKKWLESQIENLKTLVAPLLEFVGKIGFNILGRLAGLLLSPVGLGLLAAVTTVALAAWISDLLTDYVKTNVPDMSAVGPEEAAAALAGNDRGLIKKLGGREKLEEIVKNGKARAQELIKDPEKNKQAILDMGGLSKVTEIANGPDVAMPSVTNTELPHLPKGKERPEAGDALHRNVTQKDIDAGSLASKKLLSDQVKWDREYGEDYNADGSPKVKQTAKPLPSGVEASTAAAGQGSATAARMDPRRTDLVTPDAGVTTAGGAYVGGMHGAKQVPDSMSSSTITPSASMAPPMPNPIGEQVQKSISQNNNLLIQEPAPKLITIDNSKSVKMSGGGQGSGIIKDGTVDVRIDDPTLQKLQKQNYRPI